MEIEKLFLETTSELGYADKLVKNIEDQFSNFSLEQKERDAEKAELNSAMAKLRHLYRRCKNTRNHRRDRVNTQNAERRDNIRKKMEVLKQRLEEIEMEEEGSRLDPSQVGGSGSISITPE